MSRSGYVEYWGYDDGQIHLYRGAVERAIRGKRGQALLREMAAALDAMPVKELAASLLVEDSKVEDSKHVCALGAVAVARGLDVSGLDPEDAEEVAAAFGVAPSLVREVAFENDDDFGGGNETPAQRWSRMRAWVARRLVGSP